MSSFSFSDVLRLIAVAILVLANGFFVAAEFALVSVRNTRIAELIKKGNRSARWVKRAIDDPDRFIAATQLGITLASLGLGWIGEPALGRLLQPLIDLFPAEIEAELSHSLSAGLAFAIITFLHVVVGELAPKSIALQNPERTSLWVARPTVVTEYIFKPFIWALNGTGNALLRLFGIQPAASHELVHSVEELKMLVDASAQSGVVQDDEQEMLQAVFNFGETLVRQVMVPRTEVIAAPADMRLGLLRDLVIQSSHSKLPIYEGDIDHVIGMVHLKDLISQLEVDPSSEKTAVDIMRETIFIPEAARISTLLQLFRARRRHLAIVLDEYGGTAGVITVEDLLEEIFGEVSDPFDPGPEIQPLPDGSCLVDGLLPIQEINERFAMNLEEPHYDTLAGYMLGQLGRLAKVGDTVMVDGVRLRVETMDGRRIARVWLYPPEGSIQGKQDNPQTE
jgi:CBS domain containing-hemolysin-like protein